MDLHGIAAPYVGTVNPLIPVSVRISTGPGELDAAGFSNPGYATPGEITASIALGATENDSAVMTVTAIASGQLFAGQTITGTDVLDGTEIAAQLTGDPGGVGTYLLDRSYLAPVASETMTTDFVLFAQVQPMSWRDLQQTEGLNLSGTRRKIYLHGAVESVERVKRKGGDLITIVGGVNDGVWLVAQVLEQYPDWVSATITLQNDQEGSP